MLSDARGVDGRMLQYLCDIMPIDLKVSTIQI